VRTEYNTRARAEEQLGDCLYLGAAKAEAETWGQSLEFIKYGNFWFRLFVVLYVTSYLFCRGSCIDSIRSDQ
jgi:hypothetical protein